MLKHTLKAIFVICLFSIILSSCKSPLNQETPNQITENTGGTEVIIINTSTPSPTPTPTVLPEVNLTEGEQALFEGNFSMAIDQFNAAKGKSSDPTIQQQADLGIARAYIALSNYGNALEILNAIISQNPPSNILWKTYYFASICFQNLENINESISTMQNAIINSPEDIKDYFYEKSGDLYLKINDYSNAIQAFNSAIEANPSMDHSSIKIKIGNAYTAQFDYSNAIRIYMEVHDSSANDYIRAQTNLLAGQAYLSLGLPEQAYARFQESVTNYPRSYDTYSGLVALVNAGIPVDELNRGLIDYYAGRYGLAIDAFDRFMEENPDHNGTPLYYKGLSYQAMSEYTNAIQTWQILTENYPDDRFYAQAWEEIAYSQWAHFSEYEQAANTLLSFVAKNPGHEQAASNLYDAARIYERGNYLTLAAETWSRLIDEYPQYEYSLRGLFLSGVSYYRLENFDKALGQFQKVQLLSSASTDLASAAFWLAKTYQKLGDNDQANTYYLQASSADPTGYYSERAKEVLGNITPLNNAIPYRTDIDFEQERVIAEVWMRDVFSMPDQYDFVSLDDLSTNRNFKRGQAFWEIGLYEDARLEFDLVSEIYDNDPVNLFRLTNYYVSIGLYRSAILSSRQILTLANLNDLETFTAPKWFNHIRFGLYFQDIIETASIEYDFDPLLVFSMARQESFFEGFISSTAGARGVMQIMPATGSEIANFSGWPPNFIIDDLYLPYVNIKMGVNYVDRQRDYFNGDIYSALAAYNAGPGNVISWQNIANYDPELFLEIIPYEETRRYLINIYEFYKIYEKLYAVQE